MSPTVTCLIHTSCMWRDSFINHVRDMTHPRFVDVSWFIPSSMIQIMYVTWSDVLPSRIRDSWFSHTSAFVSEWVTHERTTWHESCTWREVSWFPHASTTRDSLTHPSAIRNSLTHPRSFVREWLTHERRDTNRGCVSESRNFVSRAAIRVVIHSFTNHSYYFWEPHLWMSHVTCEGVNHDTYMNESRHATTSVVIIIIYIHHTRHMSWL